jgi:hypothetical protein
MVKASQSTEKEKKRVAERERARKFLTQIGLFTNLVSYFCPCTRYDY